MKNEFDEVMAKHTDAALIEILESPPNNYQPAALEAAKREFDRRNLSEGQILIAKRENQKYQKIEANKANKPLEATWKVLSFIFPGVTPLILAWSFKADGYNKKARDLVIWTLYGFCFYIGLVLLNLIL